MTGEWTGKVRSTPTPKLTLRTVNVSLDAGALATHHGALEHLDPLAGALDHPHVHLHGVAGPEVGDVVSEAVAVDDVGRVHGARLSRNRSNSPPPDALLGVVAERSL